VSAVPNDNLQILPAFEYRQQIADLFGEYTRTLIDLDAEFADYLSLQNYDDEVANLEHKYAPPAGALYIALIDGEAAGCVGIKKINDTDCELKRLYVRPRYRGRGLGSTLTRLAIQRAKEIGYKAMFLDTLPGLQSAVKMYKGLGFEEIASYNGSPMTNLIYLRLNLNCYGE